MSNLINDAGLVVKVVISLLFLASIISWSIIIQHYFLIKQTRHKIKKFEQHFWSTADLAKLYQYFSEKKETLSGLPSIFYAGFNEFIYSHQESKIHSTSFFERVERAMRIAKNREIDLLDQNLNFLATVGSTSPYIGLLGTVWGIMSSLKALGGIQQVTISMVAPGMSEALIATAAGLFTAIPAVIAYNRLSNSIYRITQNYDCFQEEFLNMLHRQSAASIREENAKTSLV